MEVTHIESVTLTRCEMVVSCYVTGVNLPEPPEGQPMGSDKLEVASGPVQPEVLTHTSCTQG